MSRANGRALAALSDFISRAMLAKRAGIQFDGERDLYRVLGYKTILTYDDYRALYDRADIASRIVDMPARATWKGEPWLTDSKEDRETDFIKDWGTLAKRLRVWHHLARADRLAGIGRYAVLLIGLRDGKELAEPPDKVKGIDDVLYLMPYSEKYAKIEQWETDPASPHFGRPLTYKIDLASNTEGFALKGRTNSVIVHHSRVIHIAEGLLDDDVYGTPRLQRVYNRLHDLQKLAGGSAEIFWLMAAPILGIDVDPDVDVDKKELEELDNQIQEMLHNLRRVLQTRGAKVTTIGGMSIDPSGTYDMLKEVIAGTADIPQRILFGSERGELASTQDKEEWHERISARRDEFAEPTILRPLVDRLIGLSALSPPQGGGYEVQWPELGEPKLKERAETALKLAQAARVLSPEDPSLVVAPHEIREEVLDWSPVPTPAPKEARLADNQQRRGYQGKIVAAADPDALLRRIERRLAPELRQAFRDAVKKIQDQIDMGALEAALRSGNLEGAAAASFVAALAAELGSAFEEAIRAALEAGGEVAASALSTKLGTTLAFDLTSPEASAWVRRYAARQISLIVQASEDAIRDLIAEAFEKGISPQKTAQRIRDHIGLTKQQQQAVLNFRARLEAEGVTGAQLERRVSRYIAAQIRRRARTISRHEIKSAAHAGQLELWRQAAKEGLIDLDADQLFTLPDGTQVPSPPAHIDCRCGIALRRKNDGTWVKVWIVTPDERLCTDICEPIPHMPENQF